jgi:tetratricopeptide (TPR) repeat protein
VANAHSRATKLFLRAAKDFEQKEEPERAAEFRKAAELNPRDGWDRLKIGYLLFTLGQLGEAIEWFSLVARHSDPALRSRGYLFLAFVCSKAGLLNWASSFFEQAISPEGPLGADEESQEFLRAILTTLKQELM